MTTTLLQRQRWLLPVGLLLAIAAYLWADPVTRLRARQNAEAVKLDPNAGAGRPTPPQDGLLQARAVDQAELTRRLGASPSASAPGSGTAIFSVLVDAAGRVSDVRAVGGTALPAASAAAAKSLEGQRVYRPLAGAATTRTVLGPVAIG